MRKTVVLLSGGIDSAALLWHMKEKGHDLHALSFHYGQRHSREIVAAMRLARIAGASHQTVSIPGFGSIASSDLTRQGNTPKGAASVVPMRNTVLLSMAAAYAHSIGADGVAFGAHAGDAEIYADCRTSFVAALDRIIKDQGYSVRVMAPFLLRQKVDVLRLAIELGVPLEETWSCYVGDKKPCGECGACVEREKAFAQVMQ